MRHWLAALFLLACSGSDPQEETPSDPNFVSAETTACIDGHPAAQPFDLGEVESTGSGAATMESIQGQCRSGGGSGCDSAYISKEAARCVAQNDKFAPGLEAWTLGLRYDTSYDRVVWGVENLLEETSATEYSGQSLIVDAVNGRVLGRSNWESIGSN